MNFSEFESVREEILRRQSGTIDCAATNLYRALAHRIPPPIEPQANKVHRCHLASEWVARFGFPSDASRRALISCGVRDSLALLFRHYAGLGATVWLPADNYPVYSRLAEAARLRAKEFATLPEPNWPSEEGGESWEILLITQPLKPLGRWLSEREASALLEWLSARPRRRLLIDAVYTFGTQFHATTLRLFATGKVVLLHSLTKGWLHPKLFGVALIPDDDFDSLAPVFRVQSPPQTQLARARQLLGEYASMPGEIAADLARARERFFAAAGAVCPPLVSADAPGYFHPVRGNWREILERTQILGLPASVFGSARDDITILSSLSFLS